MIQAIGLTSTPRKEHPPAVDDVSFEAHTGHVTALLGAPGAGKSTALRLMLELQQGRGMTYFRGRPLHRIPHPAHEAGVLLGDVPGHPARTVRGHLRMLCAAAGVPARRADDVLEEVGLVSLRGERLDTLSRGMDRRLGLACALLPDPHALVLDDPADGLSVGESRWLHGMLRAHVEQGGTVLFATADPKEAARTADRVVTLDQGRLVADQEARDFARTRLRPRVAVRSPHAARLAVLLTKEARSARCSVEVVRENGNRLSVYGSTCADVGEAAFRHGILVHQLADEVGDMGPGAVGESPGHDSTGPDAQLPASHVLPARHVVPSPHVLPTSFVLPVSGGLPASGVRPEPASLDATDALDTSYVSGARPPTRVPAALGATDTADPPRTPDPSVPAVSAPLPAGAPQPSPNPQPAEEPRAAATPHDPDGPQPTGTGLSPTLVLPATTGIADDDLSPLPPPIAVRPVRSPLRPIRYELRRVTGVSTGYLIGAAVIAVSALTAVLLARVGHTPQARLLAAWPRELPLPPAALGAGLLGALAFGDEFRHPALAADRGTVPRRLGLLTAKLLVSTAVALLLAALTIGCDAGLLYLLYGREIAEVPADWFPLTASWLGLAAGCAWAGVLAAGVFRSTTAGLAAVVAVPVLVVPLLHKALEGPNVRTAAGVPLRLPQLLLWPWPFGGERHLLAAVRTAAQPVGGALALSLAVLLCAYLLTTLRSRAR
ncbi:ABC transporter ATP-binding protein [Streptomyces sp. YIM S03343]